LAKANSGKLNEQNNLSAVVKVMECIVPAENVCQGIFGSLMGEWRAQPGQAFQNLGEELSMAYRDVTETA
jgi:hypothetical protein